MKRTRTDAMINLGSLLTIVLLQEDSPEPVKGKHGVIKVLRAILSILRDLDFDDEETIGNLKYWIGKLSRRYAKNRRIGKKDAADLSEYAEDWRREIIDFLGSGLYFEAAPEGAFDPFSLLDEPESFFKKRKHWRRLSKIARRDFHDGCTCLAVGLPTPAAIMTMRAVEDVLRRFYAFKTKQKLSGFLDWGRISDRLRKSYAVKPKLPDELDFVRKNFRNPLAHPDLIYEQKESERLLHVAVGLIEEMLEEM